MGARFSIWMILNSGDDIPKALAERRKSNSPETFFGRFLKQLNMKDGIERCRRNVNHLNSVFAISEADNIGNEMTQQTEMLDDTLGEELLEGVEQETEELDEADSVQQAVMDAGYFDGPIPADIPAIPDLSPKRAELARFMEWQRRTVAELEHLEETHHRAVEALGGERTTKKKIDSLIEADVSEVLKFALNGQVITTSKLRAFERHQLEQKLKDDRHAAQVASQTLQQIEHQIAVKTMAVQYLQNRLERYVKAAVVEVARESDIGERYLQAIGEARELLLQLLGLGSVVGSTDRFFHHDIPGHAEFNIEFPVFELPALAGKNLTIVVKEQDRQKAAAPWRELAIQLAKNPAAQVKAG
jgi:hypothetical protein